MTHSPLVMKPSYYQYAVYLYPLCPQPQCSSLSLKLLSHLVCLLPLLVTTTHTTNTLPISLHCPYPTSLSIQTPPPPPPPSISKISYVSRGLHPPQKTKPLELLYCLRNSASCCYGQSSTKLKCSRFSRHGSCSG